MNKRIATKVVWNRRRYHDHTVVQAQRYLNGCHHSYWDRNHHILTYVDPSKELQNQRAWAGPSIRVIVGSALVNRGHHE